MLTQEKVKTLFNYNPETGILTNKINRGARGRKGMDAGTRSQKYLRLTINNKPYLVHRVVYLHYYGVLPKTIDHIDGNELNNKISNLRECTVSQNSYNEKIRKNNTSGIKGVSWVKKTRLWAAQIKVDGEIVHFGCFWDIDTAAQVLRIERTKLHGVFANNG